MSRISYFRAGNSQLFIVNTAKRTDLKNDDGLGHWLPFILSPCGDGNTDARVFTVDSSSNTNRTNSWIPNRLHHILVYGS
jgi:hypothetical protein